MQCFGTLCPAPRGQPSRKAPRLRHVSSPSILGILAPQVVPHRAGRHLDNQAWASAVRERHGDAQGRRGRSRARSIATVAASTPDQAPERVRWRWWHSRWAGQEHGCQGVWPRAAAPAGALRNDGHRAIASWTTLRRSPHRLARSGTTDTDACRGGDLRWHAAPAGALRNDGHSGSGAINSTVT